ncbi:hypothetical protein [Endozoicomonas sp. 4G]|uniref:hypothetical protein n=1 Tax=Endozoicomonas sp. 4G TaxID=2872754 RepID=UPI002078507C|nr:hypothetical protein [Endozoicomonas sp. 4G]
MRILSSVYQGLSGLARTVKDGVLSRFRGKKTEVVKDPVRQMTEQSSSEAGTRPVANESLRAKKKPKPVVHKSPAANKGYLLAKELSDQSLPAHKVSSVELPPRVPYVDTTEENQTPPSRTRKLLTALMPGNSPLPENSEISIKKAKRLQTRRLRKGLQSIKRATGLEVSIPGFDDQAATLRDFLTGNGGTPGYDQIKTFCDSVKSVMENTGPLPGLIRLAVTEYMLVLSDLGEAAQLKALGQRQQLTERFLPGHDGFKAHCLHRGIDPVSAFNLKDIRQFQEKLVGWRDKQGDWHPGLVENPELSHIEALKEQLKVELEAFIDKVVSVAPEAATASSNQEPLQAEVDRLYDQHGIKTLPDRQQNPMAQSVAEQHPVLQSATQYRVQLSGNLQSHAAVPLAKARMHHWVFEQHLADLKTRHDRLDHDLAALEQELSQVTERGRETPQAVKEKAIEDIETLHKRQARMLHSPLPTLILRDSKGIRIDSDFINKPELDDQAISLHVLRCQPEHYRQINQALLNTPGFESQEVLNQFKNTMRSFRSECYQYAIGAKLPGKVFSENDTQLVKDSRQRINRAMESLLANSEVDDTTTAFHYLRMQEVVLDNFLTMNRMS